MWVLACICVCHNTHHICIYIHHICICIYASICDARTTLYMHRLYVMRASINIYTQAKCKLITRLYKKSLSILAYLIKLCVPLTLAQNLSKRSVNWTKWFFAINNDWKIQLALSITRKLTGLLLLAYISVQRISASFRLLNSPSF